MLKQMQICSEIDIRPGSHVQHCKQQPTDLINASVVVNVGRFIFTLES